MSRGLVVAIKGAIGSGKSTLAEGLALHCRFMIVPLSDPLKGAIDDLNGASRWLTKKLDLSDEIDHRKVWQTLGNECRYELGCPEVWSQVAAMKMLLMYNLRQVLGVKPLFVVPDFRHPEEYDYFLGFCRKYDFDLVVIDVVRENCDNENKRYKTHSSETQSGGIKADFTARNDSTVANLIGQSLLMLDPYIKAVEPE